MAESRLDGSAVEENLHVLPPDRYLADLSRTVTRSPSSRPIRPHNETIVDYL